MKKWNISDKVKVGLYDMDTVEGLTEGAFYSVGKVPTVVLEKEGKEVVRWTGEVPKSEDFKRHLIDV